MMETLAGGWGESAAWLKASYRAPSGSERVAAGLINLSDEQKRIDCKFLEENADMRIFDESGFDQLLSDHRLRFLPGQALDVRWPNQ